MQPRYRLLQRNKGIFYLEDTTNHRRESLKTKDHTAALALAATRNQANAQPALNIAMARTYLLGRSPELVTRTWIEVIDDIKRGYQGATAKR